MSNKRAYNLEAALLIGPTGTGKTPLGQLLEARGLNGRACLHFDFGDNLRQIVARDQPDAIVSRADIDFLRQILATGALLEDSDFPVAARILQSLLVRRDPKPDTLIILNGLPRHVGQAESLAKRLDRRTYNKTTETGTSHQKDCSEHYVPLPVPRIVVQLRCSAATVVARIAANTGGDRTHRTDDAQEAIARKLAIYAARTAPLLDYLRQRGATIVSIDVTVEMTPAEMLAALERRLTVIPHVAGNGKHYHISSS
jgi:adenylate kinase